MSARPPDGSDQPEAPDQVMLAVLSNARREAIVLSSDEERLLDDWAAGRLAPEAAERAAGLVKRNALAAERVLERRLLDAARHSPPVPQSLAERVLKSTHPPKRQYLAAGGVRSIVGIGSGSPAPPRSPALPRSRSRRCCSRPRARARRCRWRWRRSAIARRCSKHLTSACEETGPPPSPADLRFRDVEVPTGILRNLVATAGQPAVAAPREIEAYLPLGADRGKGLCVSLSTRR